MTSFGTVAPKQAAAEQSSNALDNMRHFRSDIKNLINLPLPSGDRAGSNNLTVLIFGAQLAFPSAYLQRIHAGGIDCWNSGDVPSDGSALAIIICGVSAHLPPIVPMPGLRGMNEPPVPEAHLASAKHLSSTTTRGNFSLILVFYNRGDYYSFV
jgi:hypothetical protein